MNMTNTTTNLNSLLAGFGKLTRSCNDVRHCSRCNQPLTDPASWERGIGPICAKKDTHLFAKTIPANYAMASIHLLNVDVNMLPETIQNVWNSLVGLVLEKMQAASKGTAENDYLITGEDCRLIAKAIDFMLSFDIASTPKRDMIQVVKHLGFVGLAGVLSGESSTGEAELKFENGKLFLKGSSNKAGFNVMRRIPGITIPRKRGGGAYEAPAAQYEKFIAAVMEFWPCFDGKVDDIVNECKAWIAVNPVKVAEQNKLITGKPVATITNRSNDFTLGFVWDASVSRRLVDEIKTIPYKERSFDIISKLWTIQIQHKTKIIELFSHHYDIIEVEGGQSPSPVSTTYKPRYGGRGYGFNYYYSR